MKYIKLDWPRYEKAIDTVTAEKINITENDFYWCAEGTCGFVSEKIYEQIKRFI